MDEKELNKKRLAFIRSLPNEEARAECRELFREQYFLGYKLGKQLQLTPEQERERLEEAKEQLKFLEENWLCAQESIN